MEYRHLSKHPIDLGKIFTNFHNPSAGAIVMFSGEVRNHHQGRQVAFLEYEAYETMADKMIGKILEEAKKKWELHLVFCIHRLGRIEISESAVLVLTATSHRSEAFAANRWVIDRIKHEVPIWKKETFVDGSSDWVMQCDGCTFESEFLAKQQLHQEPSTPIRKKFSLQNFQAHSEQQQQ